MYQRLNQLPSLVFLYSLFSSPPSSCLVHFLYLLLFPKISDFSAVPHHPSHIPLLNGFSNFTLSSPGLLHISIFRRWTLWLPTWMWRSAALLSYPETERRTAAWMSSRPIAPLRSWSRQKGRVTITSTLLSLTASTGRLLSLWPLTLCRAPRPIFGGWFLTTAARQWSCSTS